MADHPAPEWKGKLEWPEWPPHTRSGGTSIRPLIGS